MSGTYCSLHKIETRGFLTSQQRGVNFCFYFSVSCCLSSLSATSSLSSHFSDLRPATPSLSSYYHGRAETEREKETLPSTPLQKKPPSITHRKPNPNTITSSLHQKPMDLLHYIAFFPNDLLFIGHHLATLFVFVTCRFLVHHGACAILALLVLAESTSACQNAWTLAKARRDDVALSLAEKVCGLLSPPFYALYSIVRAISVSILWISNLWLELFRKRMSKLEKKVE
ncbi:TLC domain-containing protein At5g14285 isoform X1 [Fagus crenata]